MSEKEGKTTSNVMVNVSLNIDKEFLSEVMVEVLRDAEVIRAVGQEGIQAILDKIKK